MNKDRLRHAVARNVAVIELDSVSGTLPATRGGGRTQVEKYFWPGEITQQIYHWQILPIIF